MCLGCLEQALGKGKKPQFRKAESGQELEGPGPRESKKTRQESASYQIWEAWSDGEILNKMKVMPDGAEDREAFVGAREKSPDLEVQPCSRIEAFWMRRLE